MATLRDIKRRIVGVSNTQQITKAMKMVAAAKLRRAQENMITARPYTHKLREMLEHLLQIEKNIDNPLVAEREPEKVLLLVVTSDSGLCGAFNMNIIRATEELIREEYGKQYKNGSLSLICIGKRGFEYFARRDYNIIDYHTGIYKELKFDFVAKIINNVAGKFKVGDIDKVIVVYNEFKSVMQQTLTKKQILPIVFDRKEQENSRLSSEFIYEPDKAEIINTLLPKQVNAEVWGALLESYAAELGARMTAMDLATENAKELIKELKIQFNKERQAAITTEILEIVSGADALKNG